LADIYCQFGSAAQFFLLFAAYGAYFDGEGRQAIEKRAVNTVMTVTALLFIVHMAAYFYSHERSEVEVLLMLRPLREDSLIFAKIRKACEAN